jgi:Lon protease-like protein
MANLTTLTGSATFDFLHRIFPPKGKAIMSDEIPLFPLDLVLLPTCRVPLHIFEERYRLMVNTCVEDGTEFGMVWGQDDNHKEIGCSARVVDIVDRFPDGRLNIIIQGTERFRLIDKHHNAPYITGIVETLQDVGEEPDSDLVKRAKQLYSDALRFTIGWHRPNDAEPVDDRAQPYTVAAGLGLPLEQQQNLLEMLNVNDRLTEMINLLEGNIAKLQDDHRKTSGNGKA